MNMMSTKPYFNRRTLAIQAMQAAAATRAKAKLDQISPICIYGLCETLGVSVRFNNINMEGMYQRGVPPRIHLSARRPLPRRAYNCAHELGHHVFGHGSSVDELREDAKADPWEDPKEFLADTFAGFILMPIIGLRRAFSVRGWTPETATPAQLFSIACQFGVGYKTLLTHLSTGVNMLPRGRATVLQRVKPKALRAEILGVVTPEPLVVADRVPCRPHLGRRSRHAASPAARH
jgi:Zn-dependent peptidase ImmA (M78 family)